MRIEKAPFQDFEFTFQCDQKWSAMKETACGKFCESCQTNVFDLSDKSPEEIHQLMDRENGAICGTVYAYQLDEDENQKENKNAWPGWGLAGITAAILSLTQPIYAQDHVPTPTSYVIGQNTQGKPVCIPGSEQEEKVELVDQKPSRNRSIRKRVWFNLRFPFVHIRPKRRVLGRVRHRAPLKRWYKKEKELKTF